MKEMLKNVVINCFFWLLQRGFSSHVDLYEAHEGEIYRPIYDNYLFLKTIYLFLKKKESMFDNYKREKQFLLSKIENRVFLENIC